MAPILRASVDTAKAALLMLLTLAFQIGNVFRPRRHTCEKTTTAIQGVSPETQKCTVYLGDLSRYLAALQPGQLLAGILKLG